MPVSDVDHANRLAWGSRDVVQEMVDREGFWSDREAQMLRRVAAECRDEPILDIGVGGGRTTPLLRAVSDDYLGIDYVPDLVSATRARYPGARVEQMDARSLPLPDGAFALVVFSGNGIDGAAHEDRQRILLEVHRVLRRGGLFAYSTGNLNYSALARPRGVDWRRVLRQPGRALRQLARGPTVVANYRRLKALDAAGEGWATRATIGYGFAVAWHRVTLAGALRELVESGFNNVELCAAGGDPLTQTPTLHLVACKH